MVHLLKTFHDKYVPVAEYQDGSKEVIHKIPLDGDQLTEERARNVQWSARMGATSYDRLEGLETNHADWHWEVKLLQVILQSLGSYIQSQQLDKVKSVTI